MKISALILAAHEKIHQIKGQKLKALERIQLAIDLASLLLQESQQIQSIREKKTQQQLAGMMQDPIGTLFTTAITDQGFRSHNTYRAADQIIFVINKYGIPHYLSSFKQFSLYTFTILGSFFSRLLIPLVRYFIRQETVHMILPGEEKPFRKYIYLRQQENVRINLNHLGEAILGEEEAIRRLNIYLKDLATPEINYISIKISTIYSQIQLLAWEDTINAIASRLRQLYRAAIHYPYQETDGTKQNKFVNLDMEEYRDLHLTLAVFKKVLEEPEFFHYQAGIVLQSYLPDSYLIQQELTIWAMQRVARGGAPIKIRIVKGANLAMEQFESALRLWPQAPYTTKLEVDANYKRMLFYGFQTPHAKAVHIGVGSHNLFDISWALILRAEHQVEEYVSFEMLEGMADPMRRVVQQVAGQILLYSPVTTQSEFQNAVAYLVRRLDENTAPQNFLRYAFSIKVGTAEWEKQVDYFSQSCLKIEEISQKQQRQQNRFHEPIASSSPCSFENEPDTDWSLSVNQAWGKTIVNKWHARAIPPIPLVIGGEHLPFHPHQSGYADDPNQPGHVLYQYSLATQEQIDKALDKATIAQIQWEKTPTEKKVELLFKIAQALKHARADLIGVMMMDTGKTMMEADVEISEAIDFANYYAFNLQEWKSLADIHWQAKGTILVAPPWNFPCSIPAGGILAALVTGNAVIFKPAPEAILVGWTLAKIFWEAGIDSSVLQFVNCEDEPVGSQLIQDTRLSAIILTGATATAQLFLKLRPDLDLMAETGGKNTLVITALADRDLAIKDLIHSAFGHAGQKCSACSLAILEAEVYDDAHFLQQLKDAVKSLHVDSAWDLKTRVNPLIRSPDQTLMRALTTLEEGETWLLQPKQDSQNANLWSPGIKLGVQPGNFTFQNELFGPVLGLVRAASFEEALSIMNQTPYGLTAGIHSLDEREQEIWLKTIIAGNCYINRTITGAVVERQPFGGCKESSFGRGYKAGGPNYLTQLMHAKQIKMPMHRTPLTATLAQFCQNVVSAQLIPETKKETWQVACESYTFYWKNYFSYAHDSTLVRGQDNLQCYVKHPKLTLFVQEEDETVDALLQIAAALICQTTLHVIVSDSTMRESLQKLQLPEFIQIENLSLNKFIQRIQEKQVGRLRFFTKPNKEVEKALAFSSCPNYTGPVLTNGRLELLNFMREVSISRDYHRYGNLGEREQEKRAPLPTVAHPLDKQEQKFCLTCDYHE